MSTAFRRLAVYCGSATPSDPAYIACARQVGETLARRGIGLVYGGGRLGLMGAVADAALAAGGEVIGIIPDALVGAEVAHRSLTQLEVVADMHARKARFTALSDGFITLPGGVGTMDELWEAVSWSQLGYHAKPVGILNMNGYYDHLLAFNRQMIETGFVRAAHAGIIIDRDEIEALIDAMATYAPHDSIFAMKAGRL